VSAALTRERGSPVALLSNISAFDSFLEM